MARRRGKGQQAVASMNENTMQDEPMTSRIFLPARFQQNDIVDITDAIPASSWAHAGAKAYYGLTEMGGIYGFLAQSVTGQPLDSMKIRQDSGRMSSYSRSFWDLELGGAGFNASEIGRRFIPRPRRFDEATDINPLRNTMPSWMPGSNYFLNFRRGDPYQKIARGEARLPGGGFEALWNYHPEEMIVRSSMSGKSPQEIMNYLLNINEGALPSSVQDAMEEGTEIHRQLEKEYRQAGFLISSEQEVYDAEAKVRGHYDVIIQTPNGPELIDFKTVSQKRWDEVMKAGKPYEENMDQVTTYLNALKMKEGGILYVNRDTGERKMFTMDYDPSRHRKIVQKLDAVRKTIRTMMSKGEVSPYELYDPLHRFMVLADTAPYSQEYKYYAKYVSQTYGDLTGTTGPDRAEKEQAADMIAKIRKRVTEMKRDHRFFPYKFKDSDLTMKRVHITGVLKNGVFVTREFPDNPIQLGGIGISNAKDADEVTNYLDKYIVAGATLTIGINPDEAASINTLGTIKAVAYSWGRNINKNMVDLGLATPKEDDWSPVGVHARFSDVAVGAGKLWESFAHMDTPFHTKFLHVASPLEEYKRRDVFGKSFQAWSIRDQVMPTIQGIMSKDPIGAAFSGGILGALVYGKTFTEKMKGAKWGAIGFASLAVLRMGYETLSGKKWIPKRRQEERNINEYFDMLEYIKYRGLYQYAAQKAKEQGFDIDRMYRQLEMKKRVTKSQRERIAEEKKELTIQDAIRRRKALKKWYHDVDKFKDRESREIDALRDERDVKIAQLRNLEVPAPMREQQEEQIRDDYQAKIDAKEAYYYEKEKFKNYYHDNPRRHKLNEKLNTLAANKELIDLSPWATVAIRYKQAYEGTLYGNSGNPSGIMGALPKKEREYFAAFLKAKPSERKEILELVPESERRFLQAAWGMPQDQKPSLSQYFKNHYLPDAAWEGWSDTKDLNDIKIKVIKNEGLDLSEFGFWKQDLQKAEANNAPSIPVDKVNHRGSDLEKNLRQILKGVGLKDIDIKIVPATNPGLQMDIDIDKDRRQEVTDYINNNLDTLL
jgi:hypothetical protein